MRQFDTLLAECQVVGKLARELAHEKCETSDLQGKRVNP
jgi:hypothetical protein